MYESLFKHKESGKCFDCKGALGLIHCKGALGLIQGSISNINIYV